MDTMRRSNPRRFIFLNQFTKIIFFGALLLSLQSCALLGSGPPKDTVIPVRLYGGDNLNAGMGHQAYSLVVRIYHLRETQRFYEASLQDFLDDDAEARALRNDLISVSEVVLTPGAHHVIEARVPEQAKAIGVVALFRSPARERWRFAFDVTEKPVIKTGLTLGFHACAVTSDGTGLIRTPTGDPTSLVAVRCPALPR
ncbi:type VI secretion system lipoprotein TssJ [Alcanivorax sp. 24]|uniref:type VI secretion system lipoprotein TssJ n=1 Tax=Alcanivorax sp. 24 TaxID=2545266 RepID=UPI001F10745D|nr:type VI secretion system lipoprotein TssJ [Alcanivorax sp. 24]